MAYGKVVCLVQRCIDLSNFVDSSGRHAVITMHRLVTIDIFLAALNFFLEYISWPRFNCQAICVESRKF
jgi:hypothetical protein